jgi:GT2 family glycosyltransferase
MLTLLLISYNSHGTISQCLAPLLQSGGFPSLIIDNASTDQSADSLTKELPNSKITVLDKNIGYGRAANIALKEVTTPYALLVNPDIKISEQQVKALLEKAQQFPDSAIFAPATHEKHKKLGSQPVEQKTISGSCMLFDMEKLRKIGFFDENIFLFSEETDLCLRTRAAGYSIMLFPDIYVEHVAGSSSGTSNDIEYLKNWHFGWSRSYYYQKHNLNNGKRSLARRLWMYRWKRLTARNNYQRVKFKGICAGIQAFKQGKKAFTEEGHPQMAPFSPANPYFSKKTS